VKASAFVTASSILSYLTVEPHRTPLYGKAHNLPTNIILGWKRLVKIMERATLKHCSDEYGCRKFYSRPQGRYSKSKKLYCIGPLRGLWLIVAAIISILGNCNINAE
jgi:hypothetical protein